MPLINRYFVIKDFENYIIEKGLLCNLSNENYNNYYVLVNNILKHEEEDQLI